MRLPEGIDQSTACSLIAFRDLFGDPEWADEAFVESMRQGVIGPSGKIANRPTWDAINSVVERYNLISAHILLTAQLTEGNPDLYPIKTHQGKKYLVRRNAKCWFAYESLVEGGHAVCIPIHVAFEFAQYIGKAGKGWSALFIRAKDAREVF